MITIDMAVKMVRNIYDRAKDNETIYKPISYSLYYAWREIQEVEKGRDK